MRSYPTFPPIGPYLIVFLGAGLGGALRHGVNVAAFRLFGSGLPYGTLTVNIVGSLWTCWRPNGFFPPPGVCPLWPAV
jgi:hypothetical protein